MAKEDYLKLSLKSIKRRGIRSWLTMLGIFVGIASIVALISLGNALETAVTSQFSDLEPDKLVIKNADVGLSSNEASIIKPLTDHDVKMIEKISGIDEVIPLYLEAGYFEFNNVHTIGGVAGVPNDKRKANYLYQAYENSVKSGNLLTPGDTGSVVLGNRILSKDYGKPIRVGSRVTIQGKEFKVKGILDSMNSATKNRIIFMSEKDVKELYNLDGQYNIIDVFVKDKDEIEEISEKIKNEFRKDRGLKKGEEDFTVDSPIKTLKHINTIILLIQIIVVGIASISLIIGGIGIANTMYASILERTKEIGIMKSIGAKNSSILRIFLYEAGLLGLTGGIIGSVMGFLLAYILVFFASINFPNIPFYVVTSTILIAGSIGFSFLVGVISGFLPAYKASKLNPVDALR